MSERSLGSQKKRKYIIFINLAVNKKLSLCALALVLITGNKLLLSLYILNCFGWSLIKGRRKQHSIKKPVKVPIELLDPVIEAETRPHKSMKSFMKDLKTLLKRFNIDPRIDSCITSNSMVNIRITVASIAQSRRVATLSSEIAACMCADSARILSTDRQVSLEVATSLRPQLKVRSMVSEILFWSTNPVLPLGMGNDGKKILLNLKDTSNLSILGDSEKSKFNLVNSMLLGLLYQNLGFPTLIVDLDKKYTPYTELPDFFLSDQLIPGYPLIFIDPVDNFQPQELNLSDSLIIGVVKDLTKCHQLVSTCFNSKILFRFVKSRASIAGKEIGVESLLTENDALFVTHQGHLRLQTPVTNPEEITRVTKLIRNKKFL